MRRLAFLAAAVAVVAVACPAAAQHWLRERSIPGDFDGQLAWDEARGRMVLFGSSDGGWGRRPSASLTFEWNGTRWMFRAHTPGASSGGSLCYDAVRRRIVAVCGLANGLPTNEVHEWDGAAWSRRVLGGVAHRHAAAATFHAATSSIVLFGGVDQWNGRFGDTLELSQTGQWLVRSTPLAPSARSHHAMAYDDARRRSVLFGGMTGSISPPSLDDTWEWDGAAWQLQQPAMRPPGRIGPAAAFDRGRGVTVLFGGQGAVGLLDDVWEYDGATWRRVQAAPGPSPRWSAAMAFDGAAGRVMLFGGRDAGERLTDTWHWDGATWRLLQAREGPALRDLVGASAAYDVTRRRTVVVGPSDVTWESDGSRWSGAPQLPGARLSAHLAFDWARSRTVLFGGRTLVGAQQIVGDTWEWDGAAWTQRSPAVAPSPREGGAMAFDPVRNVTVLFGGQSFTGWFRETWEYDGSTWRQRITTNAPFSNAFVMTYDLAIARIVCFGGEDSSGPRSETWHYDGIDWQSMGTGTPPPRRSPSLCHHFARGRTLLFGGRDAQGVARDDLWEWDGATWRPWSTGVAPEPQAGAAAVYEVANARMLLLGGYRNNHVEGPWLFAVAAPAEAATSGAGCAGSGTPPRLRADLPFLGNTGCSVELTAAATVPALLAASSASAGTPLGSGCTLLLQSPATVALRTTNAHGVASWPMPVAFARQLAGVSLTVQAAVLDGGPLGGVSLSNGVRLTAGD